MAYKYAYEKFDKESMARACGSNLRISLKKTIETAKALQGKKLSSAIKYLEAVAEEKAVVPFRRYRAEMPHQKGKGVDTGGYPYKVAQELLILLRNAQSNAKEQELGDNLYVFSVSARKGANRYHTGRTAGTSIKSTNVEVVVGVKKK